jgi:hypothetical protein
MGQSFLNRYRPGGGLSWLGGGGVGGGGVGDGAPSIRG